MLSRRRKHTLVVAAGDTVGGSPLLSSLFHDEPAIEAMNKIGLDVAAVGNHEFDEGANELRRLQRGGCHPVDGCADGTPFRGAKFPFLAANVLSRRTGKTIFPPYVIRKVGGERIAFIGMTLEGTPELISPVIAANLRFLDEAQTANRYVRRLRRAGVRAIVVLLHQGDFAGRRGTVDSLPRRVRAARGHRAPHLPGGRRVPHRPHARRVRLRDRPPARDERRLLRPPDHAHRPRDQPPHARHRPRRGRQLDRRPGRDASARPDGADRALQPVRRPAARSPDRPPRELGIAHAGTTRARAGWAIWWPTRSSA